MLVLDGAWRDRQRVVRSLASDLRPRSVASDGARGYVHVALACSDTRCALLGVPEADSGAATLSEIPGSPTAPDARALASASGKVYVAGSGVRSFDGQSWTQEVAPGVPLLAIKADGEFVVAVGSNGNAWLKKDAWRQISTKTSETLVDVAISASGRLDGDFLGMVGESGSYYEGTFGTLQACGRVGSGVRRAAFMPTKDWSTPTAGPPVQWTALDGHSYMYGEFGERPCVRSVLDVVALSTYGIPCFNGSLVAPSFATSDELYFADLSCPVD